MLLSAQGVGKFLRGESGEFFHLFDKVCLIGIIKEIGYVRHPMGRMKLLDKQAKAKFGFDVHGRFPDLGHTPAVQSRFTDVVFFAKIMNPSSLKCCAST